MARFNPIHFLAFGFGSGYAPKAPGTFGTLAAIPVYWLLHSLPTGAYVAVTLSLLFIGIWICHITARDLGVHDHPGIVWDEIVGYLVTMTAVPPSWISVVLGFVLFRVFDILKPWPIRWFDRHVSGGAGIMLDDVVAGILAAAVLHASLMVL